MNEPRKPPSFSAETVPDLFAVSPVIAERHWLRWLADQEPFAGQKAIDAEHITLAIRGLQLNDGDDVAAKAIAATNLEQRLAAFKAKLTLGER